MEAIARPLRIGIDGGCWANDRGYGRFTRELLSKMVSVAPEDRFVFFLDPASQERFDLEGDNIAIERVAQTASPSAAAAVDGSRSPADLLRFTRAVWRTPLDVFFSPSVYTYFPLPPGLRAVVGIHDAIAERFPELTLPSRRARIFWNAKVKLATRQADLILSVSEFAADDVARVLGIRRSRIRVALEAPAAAFRPSETDEEIEAVARGVGLPAGSSWFVYVGGFSPHKNLVTLVRAFACAMEGRAPDERPFLLLVGKLRGDAFYLEIEEIRAEIARSGLEQVIWTGFVPDEELRHLYSGALALVLPSDCEGFGLPAVEAAACGAPVVATTESPLPELLSGGGIFVAPRDVGALTEAISTIVNDGPLRGALGRAALARSRLLSWDRCAQEALDALREAAR